MKKYLMCIAKFSDWRQGFFDTYMSPRNKEFAAYQGYEYLEIRDVQPYRNSGTWLKLQNVKKLIDNGFLKDGDHITVIDADMCLVDARYPLASDKPFTYAIDSCNTHCMGYYSIKICEWSIRFINELLSETNYQNHGNNEFWRMWAEQASLYYITGIQRHSDISFKQLPNCGFGLSPRPETVYTPQELLDNIEIRDVHYNVTYVNSAIDPYNALISQYYINQNDFDKIIIRHWAGGQVWNEKYFQMEMKK